MSTVEGEEDGERTRVSEAELKLAQVTGAMEQDEVATPMWRRSKKRLLLRIPVEDPDLAFEALQDIGKIIPAVLFDVHGYDGEINVTQRLNEQQVPVYSLRFLVPIFVGTHWTHTRVKMKFYSSYLQNDRDVKRIKYKVSANYDGGFDSIRDKPEAVISRSSKPGEGFILQIDMTDPILEVRESVLDRLSLACFGCGLCLWSFSSIKVLVSEGEKGLDKSCTAIVEYLNTYEAFPFAAEVEN